MEYFMQISHFLLGYDIFPLKSDHSIGKILASLSFLPSATSTKKYRRQFKGFRNQFSP